MPKELHQRAKAIARSGGAKNPWAVAQAQLKREKAARKRKRKK